MKRILGNISLASRATAALLLLGLMQAAFAQADPPERVARLNFIQGTLSYLPSGGDENDWVTATLNRPITTGDRLWADANSRSELHIGSTAIRMDSNTGISLLNLDDAMAQIRLSDGSLLLRVRHLDKDTTFEVDTPNVAFSILRPGIYRIDANPDANETIITVRMGEGEVIGGGRSYRVISDQQVILTGTDSLNYDLRRAEFQPLSDLEQWARSRDEREDRAGATHYVSTEMTGYEDLDAYGAWQEVPEFGWCWYPRSVVVGWAPYRFGHWVWIAPWGWTWVADEPWGFAPFHYGRWTYYRSAWLWVPGPIVPRPVYAPALVAWVGGGNIGVSIGVGGGIGWFPLGPREVFVPSYRVSERYVTNINVTNTVVNRTTIINTYNNRAVVQNVAYVNRAVPNAVTMVSHETFVNARPVARSVISVPAREITSAPVAAAPAAAPERASVYGAGSRNAPHPSAQIANRPVVVKTPPAATVPNHFKRPQDMERPQNAPPDRPQTATPNRPPNVRPENTRPAPQPLARPAPPVRQPTTAEQQDMRAKQKTWENERSRGRQNEKPNTGQRPSGRPPRQ